MVYWVPSLGISGLTIYSGDRFPAWKGNFFVGALALMHVNRVVFNDRGPWGREAMFGAMRQRIRDVRQGPDGYLYLAVDATEGGILRLEPMTATTSVARH